MTAIERIAENKQTQDKFLDLGNCGLTELPEELFDCVWLENLNLKENKITKLNGIEKLENLEVLDFSYNEIKEFPYFLRNLPLKFIRFIPNPYNIPKLEFLSTIFSNIEVLILDNLIGVFHALAHAIEQQLKEQTDWTSIRFPKTWEKIFSQYLLLFKDFVSIVKGKTLDFYLRPQDNELVLVTNGNTNISHAEVERYFDEYKSLLNQNWENPSVTIENQVITEKLKKEYDFFILELKTELRHLENKVELFKEKNAFLAQEMNFRNEVLKEKNSEILFLREILEVSMGKAKEGIDYDQILADLIDKLIRMAERKTTKKIEDLHNDELVHYLRDKKYQVSDQTRSGRSAKGAGELDMMIRDIKGTPISIIEALRLSSCGKDNKSVGAHLHKLLYDYDPIGLERNFLILYAEAQDFEALWENYKNYIDEIMLNPLFEKGYYPQIGGLKEQKSKAADLKIGLSKYARGGDMIEIYHLFVNMV